MRQYGLIGYPLSHSFSKNYFTNKFQQEHIAGCAYDLYPIKAIEELPALLAAAALNGFNVTIPYKEAVLSYLHYPSDAVKVIGACNCVKIDNGKLYGFNTDVAGFEVSLRKKLQPHHTAALILGTGGAAKAVAYVLKKLGISFHYVSRKQGVNNYSYQQLNKETIAAHPLIINTSPLGMYPGVTEGPDIPYNFVGSQHYLFDLIYNPPQTLFMQKGAAQGAVTENGYEMLVLQAEESWKIWNS
jgi:shikimate dehydrogenase